MAELGATSEKVGIIYKYTSSSEKCYIGQTTDPIKRKSKHKIESLNLKTKFASAVKKYGIENFKYEVLFTSQPMSNLQELKKLLNLKEIEFISLYDSVNQGYNLSLGGGGTLGYKHTEEWKENASKRMMGNQNSSGVKKSIQQKEQISKNLIGHLVSEETKQKIGDKNSKAIIQLDKNGQIINEFKSASEAAQILGLNRRSISSCCSGTTKSSGGFV